MHVVHYTNREATIYSFTTYNLSPPFAPLYEEHQCACAALSNKSRRGSRQRNIILPGCEDEGCRGCCVVRSSGCHFGDATSAGMFHSRRLFSAY